MSALEWAGLALAVFASAFFYDLAIARYVAAAGSGAAHAAARWSVLTYLVGLVGLCGVLKISTWLALPEAAGLYAGTLAGVRWGKR